MQNWASKQASLSEAQRQFYLQAVDRVNSGEGLTFSWGIPIAFFRECEFYYPDADISEWSLWILFFSGVIFGGGIVYFGLRYFQTPQVSGQRQRELERQLRDEQRRVSSLQNQRSQAQLFLNNLRTYANQPLKHHMYGRMAFVLTLMYA